MCDLGASYRCVAVEPAASPCANTLAPSRTVAGTMTTATAMATAAVRNNRYEFLFDSRTCSSRGTSLEPPSRCRRHEFGFHCFLPLRCCVYASIAQDTAWPARRLRSPAPAHSCAGRDRISSSSRHHRLPLSANMTETPASFGTTVGRWRRKPMTAERDPMTLNESSVPALGVEERSDEAAVRRPAAGAARTGPSLVLRKVVRRSPQRGTTGPPCASHAPSLLETAHQRRRIGSPLRCSTTKNMPVTCRRASPKLGRFGNIFSGVPGARGKAEQAKINLPEIDLVCEPLHWRGFASDRQGMQRTPGSARILPAWTMVGLRRLVHSRACGPGWQDAPAPRDTSRHTRLNCQEDRASSSLVSWGMSLEFPVDARCGLTRQAWASPSREAPRAAVCAATDRPGAPGRGSKQTSARACRSCRCARSFLPAPSWPPRRDGACRRARGSFLVRDRSLHAEGGPPGRAPPCRQ